jgi:hypothetical protein
MISKEKIEDARENYISDTLCQDDSITSDYGYGFLTGVEFAENENKNHAVEFAGWIAEKLSKDSWFAYHPEFNRWFIHLTGHITTEQLYEKFILERSRNAQK